MDPRSRLRTRVESQSLRMHAVFVAVKGVMLPTSLKAHLEMALMNPVVFALIQKRDAIIMLLTGMAPMIHRTHETGPEPRNILSRLRFASSPFRSTLDLPFTHLV